MKSLFIAFLFFSCSATTTAQACGYSFASFYVSDSAGTALQNVKFEFLKQGAKNAILYPREEVRWVAEIGAYKMSHGMCGAHRDVTLKIKAGGFEEVSRTIELPLNRPSDPQVFKIRLKRIGLQGESRFEQLARLTGKVADVSGAMIAKVKVLLVDREGLKTEVQTDEDGYYSVFASNGEYDIRVSHPHFQVLKIVDFVVSESRLAETLNFTLKGRTDHEPCGVAGGDCVTFPVELKPSPQLPKDILPRKKTETEKDNNQITKDKKDN